MSQMQSTITAVRMAANNRLRGQNLVAIAGLIAIVVLISVPVYSYRIFNPTDNDYGSHIAFAINLIKRQPVPEYVLAHPVIQVLLIGIYWISRAKISLYQSAVIIQVAAHMLTAYLLYAWFGLIAGRWGEVRRVFWSVSLTVVTPIMALVFMDGHYYYGYIGLANYHNPTVHLLRPFALISFIFATRIVAGSRSPVWMVLASAAVIVLSALIKPNYALVILPALSLLVLVRWQQRQPVDWKMVIFGFVLPACGVLTAQAVMTYGDGGGIIVAPLAVESAYSSYLLIKLFLSILFPLAALLAYIHQVRKNPELQLGWLAFTVGILQVYLLAESGSRFADANFRWSAQIGLFLLFVTSARFLLREPLVFNQRELKRAWLVVYAYLPHLVAGVIYYIHVITSQGYG